MDTLKPEAVTQVVPPGTVAGAPVIAETAVVDGPTGTEVSGEAVAAVAGVADVVAVATPVEKMKIDGADPTEPQTMDEALTLEAYNFVQHLTEQTEKRLLCYAMVALSGAKSYMDQPVEIMMTVRAPAEQCVQMAISLVADMVKRDITATIGKEPAPEAIEQFNKQLWQMVSGLRTILMVSAEQQK